MTTESLTDTFEPMPCFACGEGTLALRDMQGHQVRYRDLAKVTIAQSLVVPGCERCGEMMLDGPQTRRLGEILQTAHAAERQRQMQEAVKQFITARQTTQGIAERLLGLSQGYLSKLLHGERVPDVQTFRSVRGLPDLSNEAITRIALDEDLAHLLPKLLTEVPTASAVTTAQVQAAPAETPPTPVSKPALIRGFGERQGKGVGSGREGLRNARRDRTSGPNAAEPGVVRYGDPRPTLRHAAEKYGSILAGEKDDGIIGGKRSSANKHGFRHTIGGKKKSAAKSTTKAGAKPGGKASKR